MTGSADCKKVAMPHASAIHIPPAQCQLRMFTYMHHMMHCVRPGDGTPLLAWLAFIMLLPKNFFLQPSISTPAAPFPAFIELP